MQDGGNAILLGKDDNYDDNFIDISTDHLHMNGYTHCGIIQCH